MIRLVGRLLVPALLCIAAPVAAAMLATPATLRELLDHAASGDTIRLAPGSYDAVALHDRHWSPPVTVDAGAATLRTVRVDRSSGLTWRGGTFDGGDTEAFGFNLQQSDHFSIDGATFRHFRLNGIGVGSGSDARLTNNIFTDMGSDGIDLALSRRIVVDHNRCVDFHPTPGAHPDCIQLWSNPTAPPTADIVVSNNVAIGDMQAFTAFNHVNQGVDDGGFDRLLIENNFAKVSTSHGVSITDCRHCVIRGNRAESLPNAQFPSLRAWIRTFGGSDLTLCGNVAVDYPGDPGQGPCAVEDARRRPGT